MEAREKKKCYFCCLDKEGGINLLSTFLCFECEQEMVAVSGNEKKYHFFYSRLKQFWKEHLEYNEGNYS